MVSRFSTTLFPIPRQFGWASEPEVDSQQLPRLLGCEECCGGTVTSSGSAIV